MWQSDVKWSDAVVEYRRKGEKDVESSPAARESFTDDGVTVETLHGKALRTGGGGSR